MVAIFQTTFSTSSETVLISSKTSLKSITIIHLTKIHHCLESWRVTKCNLRINIPALNEVKRVNSFGPSDAVET